MKFPTNDAYFGLLEGLADQLACAATVLTEVIEDPASAADVAECVGSTRSVDELLQEIQSQLDATLVAPFDRHDIHDVAAGMSEAVSAMERARSSVQVLASDPVDPAARRLAALTARVAELLRGAVFELRSSRSSLRRIGDELEPLREEAENVYSRGVEALFEGTPEPLETIRRKSLYDLLNEALEGCLETGELLERLVIKTG